jgi:hypothetical protein
MDEIHEEEMLFARDKFCQEFGERYASMGFSQEILGEDWNGSKELVHSVDLIPEEISDFDYIKVLDQRLQEIGLPTSEITAKSPNSVLCYNKFPGDEMGDYLIVYVRRALDKSAFSKVMQSDWVYAKNAFFRIKLMEAEANYFQTSPNDFHTYLKQYEQFLVEVFKAITVKIERK